MINQQMEVAPSTFQVEIYTPCVDGSGDSWMHQCQGTPYGPMGNPLKKRPLFSGYIVGFLHPPSETTSYIPWVPWARCCNDFADILHAEVARRFCQETVGLWFQGNFFLEYAYTSNFCSLIQK